MDKTKPENWIEKTEEQLDILIEWNKENAKNEIEQVRLNIETIYKILKSMMPL